MILASRSTAPERMDTDCVDYADYARCLRDLSRVNVVTLTHRPMLAWLERQTAGLQSFSLLDVACGHGDALRRVRRWAGRRGIVARLVGIDLNPWSTRAATEATPPDADIRFITGDVFQFHPETSFDFIISAHFTHHLTDLQIVAFIRWMERYAARGWYIGDLHRHWFPYYGFGLLARAAMWHQFVREDGQVSIARGFVAGELRRLIRAAGIPDDQSPVRWHIPFRLSVARRCVPS